MDHQNAAGLHLENLRLQGFRSFRDLLIPELGTVTLFTGKNSIGKTTILDAIRVYAARGKNSVINRVLSERDELVSFQSDESQEDQLYNYDSLFHRHQSQMHDKLVISPLSNEDALELSRVELEDGSGQALKVKFRGISMLYPYDRYPAKRRFLRDNSNDSSGERQLDPISLTYLDPWISDGDRMASYWDKVTLTEAQSQAVRALELVIGKRIEGVAAVSIPYSSPRLDYRKEYPRNRMLVARIEGEPRPMPLKSLGDGASRMITVGLALSNTRNGLLVMDEVENGIHYSVQPRFWEMVMDLATENHVQVVASTHAYSCIQGFVEAALARTHLRTVLVRMDRDDETDDIRAVPYSTRDLEIAMEQGIELR